MPRMDVGGKRRVSSPALPIPRNELDTHLLTVREAVDLAEEGKAADGRTALLAGVTRAREAVEGGEPWGAELVGRWEAAVENCAARHGIGRA